MRPQLTGRQVVTIVVALCTALVLTPVGVYAAATQKVTISDAKKPKQAAKVDAKGRLAVTVPGGVVAAAPARPFHRGLSLDPTSNSIGAPIPKGTSLAITSLSIAWAQGMSAGDGLPGVRIVVRKANADGTCPSGGAVHGTVMHYAAEANSADPQPIQVDVVRTFPTPQVWRATNRALCLQADPHVGNIPVVVDGFLY